MGDQSYNLKDFNSAQRYYQSAIQKFDKVIKLDSENADSYIYRGNAYLSLGNAYLGLRNRTSASNAKQNAFQDYKKAIEINPNDKISLARAYEGSGDARFGLYHDNRGAIEDYQEARKYYVNQNMTEDINRVESKLRRLRE